DGRSYPAKDLPSTYLLTWLSISLPETYALAIAGGLGVAVLAGIAAVRRTRPEPWLASLTNAAAHVADRTIKFGMVLFAAAVPLGAAVVHHSQTFDGLRLFLFVLPPVAVLAGFALAQTLTSSRLPLAIRGLLAIAALATSVITVADMARLHPYEYIYFNRLVAG